MYLKTSIRILICILIGGKRTLLLDYLSFLIKANDNYM